MIDKHDTIVVGVLIKVLKPVTVHPKYKTMFHGHTDLMPGTYVWWYPVKNMAYTRLIYECERRYKGYIKNQYGVAGTVEM